MMRPLEQDGVLDLHFQVAPCQVVVWEDTSKDDSAHTFVRFDVVATYLASLREHTTKICVGGIEAAVRTSARGGESSILSGLSLTYDAIRKHEAILEIKEKITISKLQLTVGYQDVKGVMLIGSQWAEQARTSGMMEAHGALQILQAAKRAASAAAQKMMEGIQYRAGVTAGGNEAKGGGHGSTGDKGMSASGDPRGGNAKEMRSIEAGKEAGVTGGVVEQRRSHLLVCEQVRVCIVNDCVGFNVPLVEALLAPFSIATASGAAGKGLTTKGQLKLEVSFYNILSSAFEPVLEPFKFDVSSDLYVDATGAHNFAISSKQRLELNLSETHVCSLLSTVEAWSQDLYPHIKLEDAADLLRARGSKIWPYTLRNETGCPLRFWAGRSAEPLEGSEVHAMDKDAEKPFAFAKTAAAGSTVATMELHCISVVVEGAAGSVTGVPVDSVGVHMFALDDGQALIVEVTTGEGGGKVIAVQSVVKLCNHTDLTMEIAVVTRQGNPVWLETLAPAKHFCLPTHLRECYAVLVRPVEDASVSFEWSERILLPFRSQPSSVDWSLVTCSTTPDPQGLDPSRKCFQVRVDAKKPINPDDSTASCIRAVLSVHPILRISNALPVRASFSVLSADVQDRSEHVLFEKDVDAAKQLYLYSVDKKTALGLVVNVPGLDRVRQPALIYHPQPEGQDLSDRIELVDEWGANLVLGLEHETNAWGDVTVVVYALYEIHNHSGLSLFYGQEGWDVVGLPAPRLAAGQDPSATAVQAKSLLENMLGMGAETKQTQRREGQAMLDADAAEAEGTAPPAQTEQHPPFVFCTEGEGVSAGRLCVSVGGGEWSKPLALDSLGSSGGGVLELSLPGGNAYGPKPLIELAVQLSAGGRRLERGKVVRLHPRFVVVNTTDHVLQVAQAGLEKYYALGLAAQARRVFHWGDASGARCVRMRVCKEGGEDDVMIGGWSGAVTLDAEGSFALRVPSLEGGFLNLKADVRVVGAATRLFIAAESQRHPSYLVRNDMPEGSVRVQQVNGSPKYAIEVEAGTSAVLCWEEPLESHQVTVTHASSVSVQVQLDDLGVAGWKIGQAQVTVSARGPTRILRVGPAREEEDEDKDAEDIGLAGRVPRGSALVRASVSVHLGGVGVSLLDGGLEELLYLSFTQVKAQYTLGFDDASWEVKVGRVQVDNQTDVGAPVVLHRVVRGETTLPMLHVSVVRQIDATLKWFQYVAVSLQEVRLAIHETILVRLAGVIQSIVNASSLIKTPKDLKDAKVLQWLKGKKGLRAGADDLPPPKERRLYIEALHLHPLLLHVAFTPTGEIADRYHQRQQMQGGSGGTAGNMLSFVRGLNMSFPSVEGTPLSLNALILNRFFGSGSELRSCVWQHYKQHLKRQLYMSWAPGSSALSNPSASINRVATDARDLFYDPAQALVRSPTDLKDAFRSGGVHVARSLHGGAVTFGQISRSVSKALSQLAMEEDEPASRASGRSEAVNAQEAFSEGALEFRRTLDEAAAGILKKPLQAFESDGVGGFLAGLGKGLLGGVMKPTAGMLDLAAKTSDGFVNAANDTSSEFAGRVRPPRTTPLDGTLRVFDARAATGFDVLRRVNAGAYRRELFVAYSQLQGMEAVLVTDKRLVVMEVCTLEVRFKVKMSDISSARTQGSGVMVTMKSASSQGIKFYTEALGVSSPKPDRHLSCGDLDTAEWLVSSIMACCQAAAAEDSR